MKRRIAQVPTSSSTVARRRSSQSSQRRQAQKANGDEMRIVDVDAIVLRQPDLDQTIADGSQDDLIVLVETEDGIVGIGEVDSSPEIVKSVIEAPASHANATGLGAAIVGEDDGDIAALWQQMYRASIYYGRRGPALHAMSGIEMALWDIAGKRSGKPVSALLGNVVKTRLLAYASQ